MFIRNCPPAALHVTRKMYSDSRTTHGVALGFCRRNTFFTSPARKNMLKARQILDQTPMTV